MRDVLRSSVNAWDCDHMGHMNVRHYLGHAGNGLSVLLQRLGFGPREWSARGLMVRPRDQHLRFSRELRPGMGFTIRAGVVAESPTLVVYEEMRTGQDEVSATVVTELGLLERTSGRQVPWPAALLDAARHERCVVPAYAAVRGVTDEPARFRPSRDEALALGALPGYLGPVLAEDCDPGGVMRETVCLARISDGITHVFRALYGAEERPAGIGGAALEYRLTFHAWPRVHDVIEVRSLLSALGSKTLQVTHYLFDLGSGDCVAGAQAVVAWFDLEARKAVAIPDGLRADLLAKVVAVRL